MSEDKRQVNILNKLVTANLYKFASKNESGKNFALNKKLEQFSACGVCGLCGLGENYDSMRNFKMLLCDCVASVCN